MPNSNTERQAQSAVEAIENIWIPLADGQRLAARLWRPKNAKQKPVPALLEYLPYRKRDVVRGRDARIYPWFAQHGYACLRVDLRGSGDSDGVLTDQYREQELNDGEQVIEWLCQQPWCNGKVGMMGISWSGFNALQIAARQPQALRAIISICSTDDLYRDNMHYMGGCLLTDNLSESTTMFSVNSCPPDPAIVGDRWREMWLQRLEKSGLWLQQWLQHQRRDDYWHQGSVCENYRAIQCPVMAVGGWADGYTNAVFRLMENLDVPRLGLIGPWGHKYPHEGVPGPAIGFLQEALRWWDYWLKDEDTGIMDEDRLRVWMQDPVPPTTYYQQRPGRWVGEATWPSINIENTTFPLASGRIVQPFADSRELVHADLSIQSPLSVGLFAGKWCSYTAAPDLPHDQREEDGGALVFESAPLSENLEILGEAQLQLQISCDQPVAMVAARLSSVAPDGKATRVTYGILNLNHDNNHEQASALEPGKFYSVTVGFNHIGQVFPKGDKLRISLSTSYWPLAWPPPKPVRLTVRTSHSHLQLPVRTPRLQDADIHFPQPVSAPPIEETQLESTEHNWLVHRDLARDLSTLEVIQDEGRVYLGEIDLEMVNRTWHWYSYQNDDFQSPTGETQSERGFKRGDWSVHTTTRTELTANENHFFVQAELDAWEGRKRIFSHNWDFSIPRDFI